MSAPCWRVSPIGLWLAAACVLLLALGSATPRDWSLLLPAGVIPPALLLWRWNEERLLALRALPIRRCP
jgi:hypothetical protein